MRKGKGEEGKDKQFFLVPEESLEGLAESIMLPASLATLIRRSWISWRLRSAILAGCSEPR